MTSYNELSIMDKARLLDKLVLHAENIENNFMVIINANGEAIKESIRTAKAFLRVVERELLMPGKWGNK